MRSENRIVAPLFIAVCLLAGCGSSEIVESRENAYTAIAQGDQAFEARDYATAADRFAIAVNGGGINPDAYANAAVKLVVSYGALKKFDEAHALLDKLEQGAPNGDEILAARSFVFKKQGKAAESRAAFSKAKRLNPRIQEFKG